MAVQITGVDKNSAAQRAGIRPGETLLRMNGHEIVDILDFRFYETEANLKLTLRVNPARNARFLCAKAV